MIEEVMGFTCGFLEELLLLLIDPECWVKSRAAGRWRGKIRSMESTVRDGCSKKQGTIRGNREKVCV